MIHEITEPPIEIRVQLNDGINKVFYALEHLLMLFRRIIKTTPNNSNNIRGLNPAIYNDIESFLNILKNSLENGHIKSGDISESELLLSRITSNVDNVKLFYGKYSRDPLKKAIIILKQTIKCIDNGLYVKTAVMFNRIGHFTNKLQEKFDSTNPKCV